MWQQGPSRGEKERTEVEALADDAGEVAREGVPGDSHVGGVDLVDADKDGHQRHDDAPYKRCGEHAHASSAHEHTTVAGFAWTRHWCLRAGHALQGHLLMKPEGGRL